MLSIQRFGFTLELLFACSQDVDEGPGFGSGASGANPASASAGTETETATETESAGSSGQPRAGSSRSESGNPSPTGGPSSGGQGDPTSGTTSDVPTTTNPTSTSDPSAGSATGDADTSAGGGTPLDPDLDVPDEGETCSAPGSMNECRAGSTRRKKGDARAAKLGAFGCGPIDACLDVGHPTHGVCDPFA
ncbi:MAG: hypothetical protein ACE37F_00440 [Nannocystaceae bacterium]|nr:hypothetical protein [bacterium]